MCSPRLSSSACVTALVAAQKPCSAKTRRRPHLRWRPRATRALLPRRPALRTYMQVSFFFFFPLGPPGTQSGQMSGEGKAGPPGIGPRGDGRGGGGGGGGFPMGGRGGRGRFPGPPGGDRFPGPLGPGGPPPHFPGECSPRPGCARPPCPRQGFFNYWGSVRPRTDDSEPLGRSECAWFESHGYTRIVFCVRRLELRSGREKRVQARPDPARGSGLGSIFPRPGSGSGKKLVLAGGVFAAKCNK